LIACFFRDIFTWFVVEGCDGSADPIPHFLRNNGMYESLFG